MSICRSEVTTHICKLKWHKRQSDGYYAYIDQVNEGPYVGWVKLPKDKLVIFYKNSIMKSDEYKSDWRTFVKDRLIKRDLYDSRTGYEVLMEGESCFLQRDANGKIYSTEFDEIDILQTVVKSTEDGSRISVKNREMGSSVDVEENSFQLGQPISIISAADSYLDLLSIKKLLNRLGHDTVNYAVQNLKGNPTTLPDEYGRTLQLALDRVLTQHQKEFTDMIEMMLNVESHTVCESFAAVADSVFVDKRFNWGRIVILYAFGASLANFCASRCIGHDLTSKIGETIGVYMANNVAEWIYS